MEKLTPKLTDIQLKQNIDAMKGKLPDDQIQSYVNKYKTDGQGGYALGNQEAAPQQPQHSALGNFASGAANVAGKVGNFLFPIVDDIGDDISGKSKKTALQQTGDAALSILPFIPGLGEAGEALRGGKLAVEGGEAAIDAARGASTLSKVAASPIARGAVTGYGAGVASNLSQGKGLGESFKPDINTIGGALLGGGTAGLLKGVGIGNGGIGESASDDITKVLSPTTKANKAITQKIAPELAKKGIISMSREGLLEKYQGNVQQAGQALEEGYQKLPQDAKFEVSGLFSKLSGAIQDMTVNGKIPSAAENRVAALTKMTQDLANIGLTPSEDGTKIFSDVGNVRKLRQIIDDNTRGGFSFIDSDTATNAAKKELSNSIRAEFAKQYPDIAKLNHDFSFWSKAAQVLEDTIQRKTGQGGGVIRKGIAEGIGAVGGLPSGHPIIGAGVMKILSDFVDSPAWHTTTAAVKSKLASLLESGDYNRAGSFIKGALKSVPGLVSRTAQPILNAASGR